MKAVIPLAGRGTRLRPHTLTTPKPLVKVAGRPVMSYILDDLEKLGIEEVVFVVGYLGDVVRAYVADAHPKLKAHYVVQEVQDGTAGAVKLAEPWADDELLILFVDTLFDADLTRVRHLDPSWAGIIWAKEVEDYQRFGVVVTDADGAMTRIVEKPSTPVSKLANIGLYYIRDTPLLFRGIDHVIASPASGGEFYLTDAFQYMVEHGARIQTAPVGGWYDCGKVTTLLETHAHLLRSGRSGIDASAQVEGSDVDASVRVEAGAVIRNSKLGPNVTVEAGAVLDGVTLRDTMVGGGSQLRGVNLYESIVGDHSRLEGVSGSVQLGPWSEVLGR
jgi:glucose-1-phosphate thymidylyltransferase